MADPDTISGLWTWLKADAIAGKSDGDGITTWEDSHTSNRDGTGGSPTYQTGELNSLPIVRFDGIDDQLTLPDASALTAATVFIVIKSGWVSPEAQNLTGLWNFSTLGSSFVSHYPYIDGIIYDAFGTTARKTTGDPAQVLTDWHIYTVLTKSGEWTSWHGTTQHYTTATNTVVFPTAPKLGGTASVSFWLDGDVAELILYDSDIGSTNRTTVWDYLDVKYFQVAAPTGPVIPDIVSAPALR